MSHTAMRKARGNHRIISSLVHFHDMSQNMNMVTGNNGTLAKPGVVPGRGSSVASQVVNRRNPCKNIGTWNVRTMMPTGKTEDVIRIMEKYEISILGLCETRFRNEGQVRVKDMLIIHSGSMNGQGGVAIALDSQAQKSLMNVKIINHRLMTTTLSQATADIVLIQVYMPTSSHREEEVEEMYNTLEDQLKETKASDNVIIMGDWNAIVGESAEGGVIGKYGLGVRNERGQRLAEFCLQEGFIITNTFFEAPNRRRYTWSSPGGVYRNQIDYILVRKRYRNQVKKSLAYPGADTNTDHNLVRMKCLLRLKVLPRRKRRPKWNLTRLKDMDTQREFQQEVMSRLQPFPSQQSQTGIEKEWSEIKKAVIESAEAVIGYWKMPPKQLWMTLDILQKMEERGKWKNDSTETGKENYRRLRNEVNRDCAKAKQDWYDERCEEIEQLEQQGRADMIHNRIKAMEVKPPLITVRSIKDKAGNYLIDPKEKSERWREYVGELYYASEKQSITDAETQIDEVFQITREEFEEALRKLPRNKAAGIDNLPAEMLGTAGQALHQKLYSLICEIFTKGEWPKDHTTSIMIPIPKKSQAVECGQFRTLSLISHASKILLSIIKRRIDARVEAAISKSQFGFRKGKGTRDAIATLRIMAERFLSMDRTVYICFIDYEKAFDRVRWNELFRIMEQVGIDPNMTKLIKALYKNQQAVIALHEGTTDPVRIKRGTRQGCLISPALFNIYTEWMMEEALENCSIGLRVGGELIQTIKFADDQAIVAGSARSLQILVNRITTKAKVYGMKVNTQKSKVMMISNKKRTLNINIEGHRLQQVSQFRYLGQIITDDARSTKEVDARIAMAKAAFRKHSNTLTSSRLKTTLRKRIMHAYVWSILLYGSETWTMRKQERKRIQAFEMWCYRKILKISWTERRTNEDVLLEMGDRRKLLKMLKKRKLLWLGHVLRHDNLLTTVIEGRLEGKTRRGRPRTSFVSSVCRDIKANTYEELKRATSHRKHWRGIAGM